MYPRAPVELLWFLLKHLKAKLSKKGRVAGLHTGALQAFYLLFPALTESPSHLCTPDKLHFLEKGNCVLGGDSDLLGQHSAL